MDPDIAMARVRTMYDLLAASMAPQRFLTLVLGSFAALAVLLAAIGLYGVLSYAVTSETRAIGVRMALGAAPGSVMRRVLARSLALVGAGAAIGLAGALAVTRVLGSLLFEVRPGDPATLASVTALLLLVAVVASWVPARRATRVDPAITLRAE
jgi:ABC-type antimicrobial peptide transport system permease subunit